jgi:hypothetical protein
MELRAEDGAGVVDETLVRLVVQVGEVFPPLAGEGGRVNSISVVLRSDVALSSGKVKGRDVVGTVAILELDGLGSSSESNELVAHAYTHNRDLRGLKQLAKVVHSRRAVGGVTGAVGDEDAIEVVCDLVDGVVEGEAGDTGTSGNEASKDVLLNATVDQSDVHVAKGRANVEGSLGRHATNQVDGLGVDVRLVFIGIVLLANGDAGQR